MLFREIKLNLFAVHETYYLAHCIAEDARMGAGIAVDFTKNFPEIKSLRKMKLSSGTCVKVGRVLNLITKRKSSGKPHYISLESSLKDCLKICEKEKIKKLAMPKIGCGLDGLQWGKVREMIKEIFKDSDIEILVCSI
jgi:hypothetical protein